MDRCLVQPSSQKLLPAVDGNEDRDPQTDNTQRVRDLGTLSPAQDATIGSLFSGLREPCRRGREKEYKSQKEWTTPKKPDPLNNITNTHVNSQRLGQHAQGLHRAAPDGVLGLKGEVNTAPFPDLEAIVMMTTRPLANENLVSSKGVSLRKQMTLKGRAACPT